MRDSSAKTDTSSDMDGDPKVFDFSGSFVLIHF